MPLTASVHLVLQRAKAKHPRFLKKLSSGGLGKQKGLGKLFRERGTAHCGIPAHRRSPMHPKNTLDQPIVPLK